MEKERGTKVVAIVALVVAVLGLTIGFAAYARNLKITDVLGSVTPDEMDLDVYFDNDQIKDNELLAVKGVGTATLVDEVGAVITNPQLGSGTTPTISGFRANFSNIGQSVKYTFYVYNNSSYNAYLESVSFTGDAPHKNCVLLDTANTNSELAQSACDAITLSLKVGEDTILSTKDTSFKSHTIEASKWKEVVVEIAYDDSKSPMPDGDMKVTFDGIKLGYTTIAQ